jgi:hypothetical protein
VYVSVFEGERVHMHTWLLVKLQAPFASRMLNHSEASSFMCAQSHVALLQWSGIAAAAVNSDLLQ